MVLDAAKERGNRHKEILEKELHTVGLRLNQKPPNITVTPKPGKKLGIGLSDIA